MMRSAGLRTPYLTFKLGKIKDSKLGQKVDSGPVDSAWLLGVPITCQAVLRHEVHHNHDIHGLLTHDIHGRDRRIVRLTTSKQPRQQMPLNSDNRILMTSR